MASSLECYLDQWLQNSNRQELPGVGILNGAADALGAMRAALASFISGHPWAEHFAYERVLSVVFMRLGVHAPDDATSHEDYCQTFLVQLDQELERIQAVLVGVRAGARAALDRESVKRARDFFQQLCRLGEEQPRFDPDDEDPDE